MRQEQKERILHYCKRIAEMETLLSHEIDGLLEEVGVTRRGFLTGGGALKKKEG